MLQGLEEEWGYTQEAVLQSRPALVLNHLPWGVLEDFIHTVLGYLFTDVLDPSLPFPGCNPAPKP